jgi:hypothetical protein
MSDTRQPHTPSDEPVEFDALSFSGITWFVVILTVTVVVCQVLVWGFFEWFDYRVTRNDGPRAATAAPPTSPVIEGGRLVNGAENTPRPSLLVNEPAELGAYRARHQEAQDTYGWVDEAHTYVRLPIERAKDVVLERGLLSVRPAPAAALDTPGPVSTGQ